MANNEINIKLVVDGKEATATFDITDQKLQQIIQKAKQAGDTSASSFSRIGNVVTGVNQGLELAAKAYEVLSRPLEAAGQFEKYEASLKVMLGSTEKAKARLEELSEFAKTTPFELPEVVNAGNQLQALGRYSQENLRMLGDLASASGKPMEQALSAYAKMASGQKGIAVDMFRDLLITQQDWMDATGKGISKNGELLATTEEMMAALPGILEKKNFSGMMDEQSKTLEGQMSNFKDSVGQFEAELGKMLLPVAKDLLGVLTPAVSGAKDNIGLLITITEAGAAAFITYQVAVNGATVVTKLFEVTAIGVKKAIEAIKLAFASNPFGLILAGAVALGVALYQLNEEYGNTLENQLKSAKAAEDLNKKEISETESKIKSITATNDLAKEYDSLSGKLKSGTLNAEESEKAQIRLKEISKLLRNHTQGLAGEYETLNNKLQSGKVSSEERAKIEKRMKEILSELKKEYPDIITSTSIYAGSLKEVKNVAGQTSSAIESLSGKLTELQKKQVSLSIATKQIETSTAFEELKDKFTVLGGMAAGEHSLPIIKQIDEIGNKIKGGKLSEASQQIEEFYGKYSSWAEKAAGSDKKFNIEVANAASALRSQVETMRQLYEVRAKGGVIQQTESVTNNTNKPPVATSEKKSSHKSTKTADVDISIDNRTEIEEKRIRNLSVEQLEKEKVELEEKYIKLSAQLSKSESNKQLQIETGVAEKSLNIIKNELDSKLKEQERYVTEQKKYAEKQAAEAEIKEYKGSITSISDLDTEKEKQTSNADSILSRINNASPGSDDAQNLDSLKLQEETAQKKIEIINQEIEARTNLQAKKDEIFLQDQARAAEEQMQEEIKYSSYVELNARIEQEEQRMLALEDQIRVSKNAKELEAFNKEKQNTERKLELIKSEKEARKQASQQMIESAANSYNAQESYGKQLGNSIRQEIKAYLAKAVAAAIAGTIASNPLLGIFLAPAAGMAVSALFESIIPQFGRGQVNIQGKRHKDGGKVIEIEGGESVINREGTENNKELLEEINSGKEFQIVATDDISGIIGNTNAMSSVKVNNASGINKLESLKNSIVYRDSLNSFSMQSSTNNLEGFQMLRKELGADLGSLGDRLEKVERQIIMDPYKFSENMEKFRLIQGYLGT